ncbi:MAG: hypothetical protein AB7T31_15400 [Gemmatimonadales bacterium]
MVPFLDWAVGAIVWALANVVYVDMRRKRVGGFGRFAAFWVGFPATWLSLLVVKEGPATAIEVPDDDEEALLREVRLDRRDRGLREGGAASGKTKN